MARQPGVYAAVVRRLTRIAAFFLPSLRRRRRRRKAADAAVTDRTLYDMGWAEFQQLVGEAFRLRGYGVKETGAHGSDTLVDLILSKGGETYLVQCTHWRAPAVDIGEVSQFHALMTALGATGGYVLTSGKFTDAALAFAGGRKLWLVEGPQLLDWVKRAQEARSRADADRSRRSVAVRRLARNAPSCHSCNAPSVRRIISKGAALHHDHWKTCPGYPAGCNAVH